MTVRPLRNRVRPTGEIAADPARGSLTGNRGGALHDASKRLVARTLWRSDAWICCRLAFRGRRREVMAPGRRTELFFLDEATALAAGHRPCAECRRDDFRTFASAWAAAHRLPAPPRAPDIDCALHAQRVDPVTRRQRRHPLPPGPLPDGAFLLDPTGRAVLALAGRLLPWSPAGYLPPLPDPVPPAGALLLTPPVTVAALRAGYPAALHPTAAGCRPRHVPRQPKG